MRGNRSTYKQRRQLPAIGHLHELFIYEFLLALLHKTGSTGKVIVLFPGHQLPEDLKFETTVYQMSFSEVILKKFNIWQGRRESNP